MLSEQIYSNIFPHSRVEKSLNDPRFVINTQAPIKGIAAPPMTQDIFCRF